MLNVPELVSVENLIVGQAYRGVAGTYLAVCGSARMGSEMKLLNLETFEVSDIIHGGYLPLSWTAKVSVKADR